MSATPLWSEAKPILRMADGAGIGIFFDESRMRQMRAARIFSETREPIGQIEGQGAQEARKLLSFLAARRPMKSLGNFGV
jgi:hypothetical protein